MIILVSYIPKLFHPLLPVRCRNKLMFPLCAVCAQDPPESQICNHTNEERALVGTWVSEEIKKAIELGYVLVDIYEVWHFEESSDSLFRDYINSFLAMKQEAKGFLAVSYIK